MENVSSTGSLQADNSSVVATSLPVTHAAVERSPATLLGMLHSLAVQSDSRSMLLQLVGATGLAQLARVSRSYFRSVQPLLPVARPQTAPRPEGAIAMLNSDEPLRSELGHPDPDRRVAGQKFLVEWTAGLGRLNPPYATGRAVALFARLPDFQVTLAPNGQLELGTGLIELALSEHTILRRVASKIVEQFTETPYDATRLLQRHSLVSTGDAPPDTGTAAPLVLHPVCRDWVLLQDRGLRDAKVRHMLNHLHAATVRTPGAERMEQALARFLKDHPRKHEPAFERALVAVMSYDSIDISDVLRSDEFTRALTSNDGDEKGLLVDTVLAARDKAVAIVNARREQPTDG